MEIKLDKYFISRRPEVRNSSDSRDSRDVCAAQLILIILERIYLLNELMFYSSKVHKNLFQWTQIRILEKIWILGGIPACRFLSGSPNYKPHMLSTAAQQPETILRMIFLFSSFPIEKVFVFISDYLTWTLTLSLHYFSAFIFDIVVESLWRKKKRNRKFLCCSLLCVFVFAFLTYAVSSLKQFTWWRRWLTLFPNKPKSSARS